MVNYRLSLFNEQGSPTIMLENCPVLEKVPISINYQISDVRNPDKGIGSMSKTIQIPGTKEVLAFFEFVNDPNINLQKYNPNLKIRAQYFVKSEKVFEGYLQITNIKLEEITRKLIFECQIVGEVITLFTKVKDKFLTDLDFSEYDHELTYTDIVASWTNNCKVSGVPTALANGEGYVYPLADYGTNNSNLSQVRPTDLRGCLFRRQILKKIFDAAGYTWTSTFLDSADFKKKIMPPTEISKLSQTDQDNAKFLAVADGTQTAINLPLPIVLAANSIGGYDPTHNPVEFQNETYDAGGMFTTPAMVVGTTAKYNLAANLGLKFVITRDTGSGPLDVSANMTCIVSTGVHVEIYNNTTSTVVGIYDLDLLNGAFGTSNQFNASVNLNDIQLIAGDVYFVAIRFASVQFVYTAAVAGATWALDTYVVSGSNFSVELSSANVYEGSAVNANDLLPVNYKQSDFITDLRKEFNLFFLQDKANPNNIIIERRPAFYTGNIQNWDKKHDRRAGVDIIPMGELDFIQLIGKHADDGDFYNKLYADEFKENYATYTKNITNDFVKGTNTIEMKIAATPYAVNPGTGIVVPTIIKKENNNISTIKCKPRSWHWSGVANLPIGLSWKFYYNNDANVITYNTIPMAGHTDNPWNPSQDLSWGVPKKTYFTYANQQWTTNNLYNSGYSQYINEVMDKNSKIIRTRFYLSPKDIAEFDFRNPISTYIDRNHVIGIVNKLEDYNPLVDDTTMVEILVLTQYSPFVPGPVAVDTTGGGGNQSSYAKVANNNIINSPNSYNYGNDSMISGGNNNFIALNSNAQLINCKNVVVAGNVTGFVGIGLSNVVIDSSYSEAIVNGNEATETLTTGSYDLAKSYNNKTLYLDASGGDITLKWDPFTMNDVKVTLIRTDSSANFIYLDSTLTIGTENYKGSGAFPIDLAMAQYDSLKLTSKSDLITTTT